MDGIPVSSSAPSDASHAAHHPADFLFAHSHHQDHHDEEEQDVHAMLQDALRAYEDNVDPANAAAPAAGHDEQHLHQDHGDEGQDTAETDHLALVRAAAMGGAAPATAQTDDTGYGAATAEGAAPSTSATGPPLDGAPPAAASADQDAAADAPTYVDAPAQRPGRGPGSRARWTPQEDQTLVDLVRIDPPLTWTEIGKRMGRPGTGCGMRWYKFLRDKVAAQDEAAGVQTTEGASTGEDAMQEQSEEQTEGAQQLEPSSEMVVGGSGANAAVAADGGSSSNANGSQTGESASPDPSAPGASSSAQRRGTRKTITNVQTGRIVDLPYVPPSQLPPALPPSASLPGHPYPRPEGKVHSNAGKGYLPLSAMVAQPPIPFAKNTVLRGRRTKAADVPPPPADAATAGDASAVAAAAADGASSQSPIAGAAGDDAVAAAAAARPKKGKGAKGGLSKAGTSVHKCPAENCEAAFKRSEHLRRHYKSVHRGEKPFPCTVAGCGKSFSRKDNLQQHQAMVHYVRALYTYPDGNTTTDPPEAGDPSAANVTVTFEQVDIQRTPRGAARKAAGGRSKSKQVAAVAGAKPEDEGGAADQGDALASENGAEHAQQDGSVQQGAASSSRAGALPPLFGTAAAAYSTAPSASMSPHGAGARDTSLAPSSGAASVDGTHNGGGVAAGGAGTQLGDLYAPDGPGSRGQKRARSAASGSGAGAVAADEDDGEGHGAGAIDKRLRLTGLDLDAHGVDHLDPALQVLAAQAQQHPQGHAAHVLAQAQAALLSQHQHHLEQQQQQQQGAGGAGEPARSITPSQGAFNAQPQLINALARQLQLQQQQQHQQQDGAAGGDMLVDAPLDHLADGLYVPGLAAYLSENGHVGGADGGPA